ncbi:hypothetical protein GQ53DRAFT_821142 [Thozetella sp. PMI_491]|nr:hypothetical protein GQ53DRAFT_821142 [Thozetella sp. PMI_491]
MPSVYIHAFDLLTYVHLSKSAPDQQLTKYNSNSSTSELLTLPYKTGSRMVAQNIISSLTREEASRLIRKYGNKGINFLWTCAGDVLQTGSQLYTDSAARGAHAQQQEAFKALKNAIPEFLNIIESKEIHVIHNSFNSSSAFTTAFQSTALVAIPLALLAVKDAIDRVGSSLKGIQAELAISNLARIQGWEANGGFGSHIHRFVDNEMREVALAKKRGADTRRHYFYVWHPDTDWYPAFEKTQRKKPLGRNFGGYNIDLGVLCNRMSSDRAVLIRNTSHGREAVFHLLIPAYSPIVTSHPVAFHSSLFPLVITGQRHRGVDLVWFDIPGEPRGLDLHCIGKLDKNTYGCTEYGAAGFVLGWVGAAGCAATATLFPPLAPAALAGAAYFTQAGMASWAIGFGGCIYDAMTQENISVLGCPLFTFCGSREANIWTRFLAGLKKIGGRSPRERAISY